MDEPQHVFTPHQLRFIEEYPIDTNGTRAAIRAGYSPKCAAGLASDLLKNAFIMEAIRKNITARMEKTTLSQDWVITRLMIEATREGIGSHPNARCKALELLGKHLGMYIANNVVPDSLSVEQAKLLLEQRGML